jgi:hypothetical protein
MSKESGKEEKPVVIKFTRHLLKSKEEPVLVLPSYPSEKEKVITADELEALEKKTFGDDYLYYILISDEYFYLPSLDQVKKLLKKDKTDRLPYIPVIADCDDYSDVLLGALTKMTWTKGYAFGQLWFINEKMGFGHACNLVVDDTKTLYIIEPQNDGIYTWGQGIYSGKAYMVKF